MYCAVPFTYRPARQAMKTAPFSVLFTDRAAQWSASKWFMVHSLTNSLWKRCDSSGLYVFIKTALHVWSAEVTESGGWSVCLPVRPLGPHLERSFCYPLSTCLFGLPASERMWHCESADRYHTEHFYPEEGEALRQRIPTQFNCVVSFTWRQTTFYLDAERLARSQ
jgi:hypothetical protein